MNHVERLLLDSAPFRDLDAKRDWLEQGIWPANWITIDPAISAPCRMAFQLKFSATGYDSFFIHVAADEKYQLFLDGNLIGFGSERGSIERWHFDSYQLTLLPGGHALLAIVQSHGASGLRSQISLQPGFLLASEPGDLCTGKAAWEGKQLPGFEYTEPFEHGFFSIGKNTVQHGNPKAVSISEEIGWQKVCALHPGSTTGIRNRHPEIHLLTPSLLPPPVREVFRGGKVIFLSSTASHPLNPAHHLSDEAISWNEIWRSGGEWSLPAHQERRIIIDLEDYVCAWPEVTLSASPGSKVSLLWAESLFVDEKGTQKGNRNEVLGKYFIGVGDEFYAADHQRVTFEAPFIRTGRYLQVKIATASHPLTIAAPKLYRAEYPLAITSHFKASGFPAASIIARCQRTLKASCHDAIIDGPYYEQMAWLGDTAQVAAVLFSASRDDRPLKKNIAIFDSSRLPNGHLRSRWPARDSAYVSAYAMTYGTLLHDHLWWRDDAAFLKQKLAGHRATLNYYLDLVGPDDLLKLTTGWPFADWVSEWKWGIPPVEQDGTSGLFQWQLIRTLSCAAAIETTIGEPELAQFYQRRAREMARAADIFWNDEKGLIADTRTQTSFSEHTQSYAILSGVLDTDKQTSLRAAFLRDEKMTRATGAFAHYLYEAWFILGLREKIVSRLRDCELQEELGFLTTPESPEPTRSDCHGWSAVPHFHLFASLLGIRPTVPFFRKVRIDPMWDLLGEIDASLPHPQGKITLRLVLDQGKPGGEVILPQGITGILVAPNGELPLSEGKNRLGY